MVQTTNESLQHQLGQWLTQIDEALAVPSMSKERQTLVRRFCEGFVPHGIDVEDIDYFSNNLFSDEEYFESLRRDIHCCLTGERVESVVGNQRTKAVFTILPPDGTLSEGSTLDIVREVAFISSNGSDWRAEG